MARINLSNAIKTNGRELFLQTNTLEQTNQIVSTLFEGGRVLAKEIVAYSQITEREDLVRRVKDLHVERLAEIEFLYSICDKVRKVRHPQSVVKLGRQFLKWNLVDDAIDEFEFALQRHSGSGELYLNLGEAYARKNAVEEAMRVLERGVTILPDYADLWHKLGVVLRQNHEYDRAIDVFNQCLEINSAYAECHFSLALTHLMALVDRNGSYTELEKEEVTKLFKEHLGKAVTISPLYRTPKYEEAMRRFHRGESGSALKILSGMSRSMPMAIDLSFHDAFYLSYVYGERGRDPKLIQKYIDRLEELVRRHPNYPDLRNLLGIAHLIGCRHLFTRSIEEFQKAVQLNPGYDQVKKNLALSRNEAKGLVILLRALLK